MNAGLIFFLIVIVGAIAAYFYLKGGEDIRFETTATTDQAIQRAVSVVQSKRHWTTISQTSTAVSFTYTRGANKLLLVVLLLFFLVPGIVYWILSGKKESMNVTVDSSSGASVVQCSSNGWRGKFAGRDLRSALQNSPDVLAARSSA